jgi:uncharacterized protein YcbX
VALPPPLRVSALYVFPVKSCAGLRVEELALDALGAARDRRFMLVDERGGFVSQREQPRLALVRVAVADPGGIALCAAGRATLSIDVPSARNGERDAVIWDERVRVRDCGDPAAAWFSDLLEARVRLVHLPNENARTVDPTYAPSDARVALADGFPLLVATDASLADLAEQAGATLEMERFRPNAVIGGGRAWDEDRWEALCVGAIPLRLVKPCARCSMTLLDPATSESGAEPLRTLARFRRGTDFGFRRASAASTYFGWNALHERTGTLRVGDAVTVTAHRLARHVGKRSGG